MNMLLMDMLLMNTLLIDILWMNMLSMNLLCMNMLCYYNYSFCSGGSSMQCAMEEENISGESYPTFPSS